MNIGLFLEDKPSAGGSFYQCVNDCRLAIEQLSSSCNITIFYRSQESRKYVESAINFKRGINHFILSVTRVELLIYELKRRLANALCIFPGPRDWLLENGFEKLMQKKQIDLVLFFSPSNLALYLNKTAYTYTVWDLCHREYPEFLEAGSLGEWIVREEMFQQILPRAFRVVTNSEFIKSRLQQIYHLSASKIEILPLSPQNPSESSIVPSPILNQEYLPDDPYIIYPAKFWPHKNHIYIIKALALLLNDDNIRISALFVGSPSGTYQTLQNIKAAAMHYNIEGQISFLYDLTWAELNLAYQKSLALIMPTFFGPTNIPILEAFQLNVPAFYSDLPGFKEEYGNACRYMNLHDPHSLRIMLKSLVHSRSQYSQLQVETGKAFLENLIQKRNQGLFSRIVSDYAMTHKSWI